AFAMAELAAVVAKRESKIGRSLNVGADAECQQSVIAQVVAVVVAAPCLKSDSSDSGAVNLDSQMRIAAKGLLVAGLQGDAVSPRRKDIVALSVPEHQVARRFENGEQRQTSLNLRARVGLHGQRNAAGKRRAAAIFL